MRTMTARLAGLAVLLIPAGLAGCSGLFGKDANNDPPAPLVVEAEASTPPKLTAETHFAAGQVAEMQGDYANALAQYGKALEMEPNNPSALFRLAMVQTRQREFDAALVSWKRYVELTEESAAAWSNLALCYEMAGHLQEAEKAYLKGIEKEPLHQVCRVNYGLMLARQKRYQDAADQFGAVLGEAEVHYNIASVLEQQGHLDRARQVYQRALEIKPGYWEARSRLDMVEQKLRQEQAKLRTPQSPMAQSAFSNSALGEAPSAGHAGSGAPALHASVE